GGRPQQAPRRADGRIVVGPGGDGDVGVAAVVPGQPDVHRRRVGVVHAVMDRTNDGAVADLPGQTREVFAELNAGHARGDGAELAADLDRRGGLHVPHGEVAPAPR